MDVLWTYSQIGQEKTTNYMGTNFAIKLQKTAPILGSKQFDVPKFGLAQATTAYAYPGTA